MGGAEARHKMKQFVQMGNSVLLLTCEHFPWNQSGVVFMKCLILGNPLFGNFALMITKSINKYIASAIFLL